MFALFFYDDTANLLNYFSGRKPVCNPSGLNDKLIQQISVEHILYMSMEPDPKEKMSKAIRSPVVILCTKKFIYGVILRLL